MAIEGLMRRNVFRAQPDLNTRFKLIDIREYIVDLMIRRRISNAL
jgi:hypothetical protein